MRRPYPAWIIHIISCNARVGEEKRVNRRAGFCGRKTVKSFIQKYAVGLKAPEGFNLRIDITDAPKQLWLLLL